MTLSTLDHTDKRIFMFGGKGGVGKTTSSAATALHYALSGRRTLIITSDYTPSLSDIFEVRIGPRERAVPRIDNLFALEIDPDEVMRRWKRKFGPEVYEAASSLVDMPYDELVGYVAMAPGIQEEFMLDYILERIREKRYDLIVWDTAPAGDTLRLLDLPRRFIEHLRTAPKVYMEVRDAFNLSKTPFVDLIESWKALAEEVTQFFSDPETVEFILVTIPEALGVYQTRRIKRNLEEHGINVRHLILNHVIVEPSCDFLRQRREMQLPYIEMLQNDYGETVDLVEIPLMPFEVKGVERLKEVEARLFGDKACAS
ncbi:MAG: ArsA family ATPase [Anaerolineae bacterium]|jgi:arsenite-transporting ATPase